MRDLNNREIIKKTSFRFPFYTGYLEESFVLSMTEEERKLYQAQQDFYACDFEKSRKIYLELIENTENIYVKICACFYMCVLCSTYDANINSQQYYFLLNQELAKDFPYKKEMEVFLPLLCCFWGQYKIISPKLKIDPTYEYHPSVYYLACDLSAFEILFKDGFCLNSNEQLSVYELLCQQMEREKHYYEAQSLHIILFVSGITINSNEEYILYHLRKALRIAQEHNMLYMVADQEPYFTAYYKKIKKEFPAEFMEKIHQYGKQLFHAFALFTKKYGEKCLYFDLSPSEFQYVYYVWKGYSNKQIAEFMHLSERTVSNKFSTIYQKLNIKNRQELYRMFYLTLSENKYPNV